MLTIAIDCGDQRPKGRAALAGDLLQTVPELVFNADARLVACNDNRSLRNLRPHGFSPANTKSKEVPCLTVERIISTCGRNNTVNGERLEYFEPVSAGIGGQDRRGSRGPLEFTSPNAPPGALTNLVLPELRKPIRR